MANGETKELVRNPKTINVSLPASEALLLKFCNHLGKLATGAIRGICKAEILEDLEKSLLLVEESDMCLGAINLTE